MTENGSVPFFCHQSFCPNKTEHNLRSPPATMLSRILVLLASIACNRKQDICVEGATQIPCEHFCGSPLRPVDHVAASPRSRASGEVRSGAKRVPGFPPPPIPLPQRLAGYVCAVWKTVRGNPPGARGHWLAERGALPCLARVAAASAFCPALPHAGGFQLFVPSPPQ